MYTVFSQALNPDAQRKTTETSGAGFLSRSDSLAYKLLLSQAIDSHHWIWLGPGSAKTGPGTIHFKVVSSPAVGCVETASIPLVMRQTTLECHRTMSRMVL